MANHAHININLSLIEREGGTGEYWPQVVAVQTRHNEFCTVRVYIPQKARVPSVISLNLWLKLNFLFRILSENLSLSCDISRANICVALIVYPLY